MKILLPMRMVLITFLFSILAPTAYATKMAIPTAIKIYSGNKKYYIDFIPESKKQKVMRNHQALWSFTYPVQFDDSLFISNNGKYVYVIRSKFVENDHLHKPALMIFSASGLKAQYSYKRLSIPRRYEANEAGPIGSFWRIWRKEVKTNQEGNFLIIEPEGKIRKMILMNAVTPSDF
jgi:hypothetical protein